jgi:hypothetical protein
MSTVAEEVWIILRELIQSQKETDLKFKETDLKFKETDLKFKETDLEIKETARMFRETDKKLNQLERLFTSQWGKLMESLVEGDLVRLLTERGIAIADTTTRLKGKNAEGGNYEFDIIAHDGDAVVVVEVKTTLRPQDVEEFLAKLGQIKRWIPRYAHNRIHGAVAWLTADAGAERMAENKGLFSIRATGDSASIQNDPEFAPRAW